MANSDESKAINRNTAVSIGLVLAVGTVLFGGVLRVLDAINDLERTQAIAASDQAHATERNTMAIDDLRMAVNSMATAVDGKWTYADMKTYVDLLRAMNPEFNWPDPRTSE